MPDEKKTNRIVTPMFRASFANVFKPRAPFEGQEPKYSVQMLFPKGTDLTEMKKAAAKACEEKWGTDRKKWPKFKHPVFKDGNEKNLKDYEDMTVVEARSKQKPGIVDRKMNEILDPSEFYSGCWARATLSVFCYDKAGNKGVSFGLQNLQKLKDDEAFSGKRNPKDDFEALEDLEDDAKAEEFESAGADDSDNASNDDF